jgi:hypothetical protein
VKKFLNIDTEHNKTQQSQNVEARLDSNIRNSVCTYSGKIAVPPGGGGK